LGFGRIFWGRASSIFLPVASGYELKNGLASPKNLLAKTSNNILNNVLSPHFNVQKTRRYSSRIITNLASGFEPEKQAVFDRNESDLTSYLKIGLSGTRVFVQP
jgi:hypothetical protein